jgi:2-polyprenyl-3-methyl-5-hydroxy-6-metoxy-1,4-benzoquinol methylase
MAGEKRDFDKVAATWEIEPKRVKLAADVARAMFEELKPARSMDAMDFGCGTGLLTLALQPAVRSITGVDASRGMLDLLAAKARERRVDNVATLLVDGESGDLQPGRYHLIVSSMALHHVRETGLLFRRLFAALVPSGSLGIADLDPDDGEFHADSTGVFHNGFERETLRRQLAEAGFDAIRARTAAAISKPARGGKERTFSIFLITAKKPPSGASAAPA